MENIGERIVVLASFGDSHKIKPVKFKWSQRVISVKEVTYTWIDMAGNSRLYHFSVTDGGTLYEISFNTTTMQWFLEKVEPLL